MFPKRAKIPGSAIDRLNETYHHLLGKRNNAPVTSGAPGINRDIRNTLVSAQLREEMAQNLVVAAELGFSAGDLAEASIMFKDNHYLVTRKGCWLHDLSDDDLIYTSPVFGKEDAGEVPAYWNWHLEIYNRAPSTKAIFLGQPSAVLALAQEDRYPDQSLLPDAAAMMGNLVYCKKDGDEIAKYADPKNILVIPGMGVISQGRTLKDAIIKIDLLSKLCKITLMVKD